MVLLPGRIQVVVLFTVICLCLLPMVEGSFDPYKILGVARTCNSRDLKRAYNKLVKQWHPDRNKAEHAQDKFIEISRAYQILSDPQKRADYDHLGYVREDSSDELHRRHPFPSRSPFHTLFNEDGFGGFNFNFRSDNIYNKYQIDLRRFERVVLPRSEDEVYVLITYSDFCLSCMQMEPIWERLASDLKSVGVNVGSVHARLEPRLARKVSSSVLPTVVGVIDGRVYFCQQPLGYSRMLQFTKDLFPANLVVPITEESSRDFLRGWADNKVRILFFTNVHKPRLKFKAACHAFKNFVACGYVNMNGAGAAGLMKRYGIRRDVETVTIFNEDSSHPLASSSMPELSVGAIKGLVESNKYLALPRLSSQQRLDELCRVEPVPASKHLCVVLFTRDTPAHQPHRDALRNYSLAHASHRVSYAYVYEERQADFVRAFDMAVGGGGGVSGAALPMAVLWRHNEEELYYKWLRRGWGSAEGGGHTADDLARLVDSVVGGGEVLEAKARLPQRMVDEHGQGLASRVMSKLFVWWDYAINHTHRDDVLSTVSILFTLVFIVVASYLLSYVVHNQDEAASRAQNNRRQNTGQRKREVVGIHELRLDTYMGLVRMLKPGCRTLVLLVDDDSKHTLLTTFTNTIYPYRKNASLMFAYLNIGRYLHWYRSILQQTVGSERPLHINSKNCVGTVLSLNGYRKYYSIYHPKVLGCRGLRRSCGGGDFLGMEDTSSDQEGSDDDDVLYQEELLDGLRPWLEKLFDGQLKRFHLDFWPEMRT